MKINIEDYVFDTPEATQKINVKIDAWDTWSMDHTLAHIIVPMLKQLKETKHGAPNVDDEDVPIELRYTEKELCVGDEKFFARWNWVLDEMTWAFEQKTLLFRWEEEYYDGPEPLDNSERIFDSEGCKAHQERMTNGFKLFGKFYEYLWD